MKNQSPFQSALHSWCKRTKKTKMKKNPNTCFFISDLWLPAIKSNISHHSEKMWTDLCNIYRTLLNYNRHWLVDRCVLLMCCSSDLSRSAARFSDLMYWWQVQFTTWLKYCIAINRNDWTGSMFLLCLWDLPAWKKWKFLSPLIRTGCIPSCPN